MRPVLSISQFLLFAGLGGIGTIAHYSLLILLVQLFRADPVPASLAGFLLGAIVNFLLSHHIAFRSGARRLQTAPRFFIVAVFGFFINWLFMWLLVASVAAHYLLAQVVATAVTLAINYIANALWTFGRSGTDH
jgi:putative flippase GtrA